MSRLDLDLDLDVDVDCLVRGGLPRHNIYQIALYLCISTSKSKSKTEGYEVPRQRLVNKRFIHSGQFPREFTSLLTPFFEDRQGGDYDVTIEHTEAKAREDVADAARIVDAIVQFLARYSQLTSLGPAPLPISHQRSRAG